MFLTDKLISRRNIDIHIIFYYVNTVIRFKLSKLHHWIFQNIYGLVDYGGQYNIFDFVEVVSSIFVSGNVKKK